MLINYYTKFVSYFLILLLISVSSVKGQVEPNNKTGDKNNTTNKIPQPQKKHRIVILDFDDGTNTVESQKRPVGTQLAYMLADSFIKSSSFVVVEREEIEKVSEVQNQSLGNRFDPTSASKIGKLFSADIVILGTIIEYTTRKTIKRFPGFQKVSLSAKVVATIRILDVNTGIVLDSVTVNGGFEDDSTVTPLISKDTELTNEVKTSLLTSAVGDAAKKAESLLTKLIDNSENSNNNKNLPTKEAQLSRYPNIESPKEVFVNREFAVNISLTQDKPTQIAQITSTSKDVQTKPTGELNLTLPKNIDNQWNLDVILTAPSFTTKDSKNIASITLPLTGNSDDAIFYLTPNPLESNESERKTRIFATFIHNGAFLAKVEREIIIKEPLPKNSETNLKKTVSQKSISSETKQKNTLSSSAPKTISTLKPQESNKSEDLNLNDKAPENKNESPLLSLSIKQETPDMTIFIQENVFPEDNGNSMIQISSPYFKGMRTGTFSSNNIPQDWIIKNYSTFSSFSSRGAEIVANNENTTTRDTIRGFGRNLFNRLPEVFKKTFWELQNNPRVRLKTILIITNNPLVPWELVCPIEGDKTLKNDFLGLEFNIGRLHNKNGETVGDSQPQTSTVSGITVIAPKYIGNSELKSVFTEVSNIKNLNLFSISGGFEEQDGKVEKIRNLFETMPPRIIHFAGHGVVERNKSLLEKTAIKLANGELLDSTTLEGMLNPQSKNHPLFFINACDTGQSEKVFGFIEGWAPKVMEAGASGYIGALWAVNDKGASDFATKFYQKLEKELKMNGSASIPDLLRQVKQEFNKNNDATFISYIFYGDPNLILKVSK